MTRSEQATALHAFLRSIVETVKEAGSLGAPGGVLYSAMMAHGCSLDQFETIMGTIVKAGKLRKSGDVYHWRADL